MTQPTTGGLGDLGGYLNSPGFGNLLQAAGMSLMSSPRNAPLQNFGKLYVGLQDQQMQMDERDQQRGAIAAALKSWGFSDDEAMQLSANPDAAKIAIEQRQAREQKAADDSFYARRPAFGGFGGLGGLGSSPDVTGSATDGLLSFPGVFDAGTAQAAPTGAQPLPDSLFRTQPDTFSVDNPPQPLGRFEFARNAPAQDGNRTLDWLRENDPEVAALVTPDSGITPRDAFEIAQVRQRTMGGLPQEQAPDQPSGNLTLDYLKKHAPDVAALTEGPDGISVRDAYGIHVEDRKLRQAADETQAKLDQLYRYRDRYAQWASTARSDKTYNVAKRGLDDIDTQISRLERQQTRLAPPDSVRALQMRAELAGLQPGTPEYQKFMASGGREGSLVTINNSPEGDMFAGMPKDIREEMFKRQGEAQDAADLIGITNQGLQLLDQGAITGAGSGAKVAAVKWAQSLGVPIDGDIADAVNNAETYRAVMAQAVGKVIKNFGSGTGLSDADRQYAEQLAGGDTTLNEPAIRRILAAGVKSAKSKIGNFNSMRDKVLSGDLSAILNVQEPPEYSAPAAGGGTRARNPQTGETLEWDGSQWRPVQ